MVLHARSRARKTPPASITSQTAVVQRILEMRESLPENLHRVPRPEAILYYLHRDPALRDLPGCACHARRPPSGRSCAGSAVWRRSIAANPNPCNANIRVRRSNLTSKTPPPCLPNPRANESRVVEITNFVDAGTSIWLSRSVGGDFDAEGLLEVVAQFLREHGLPAMLTFDDDPRFVGSASGRDFPSALVRLLLCVGVEPNVCPPHRPDKNASVERFHRTLGEECLRVQLPRTLEQVKETISMSRKKHIPVFLHQEVFSFHPRE